MDYILFLVFVIVGLLVTNLVSLFYVYKFGKIILRFEDSVEEALEDLDDIHLEITEVLKTPLFYDSPEVKKVISQIERSRNVVIESAQKIAKVFNQPEGEELEELESIEDLRPVNNDVISKLFERQR